MNHLKRFFITPYLLSQVVVVAGATLALFQGIWSWGALLLTALPVAWITVVHTLAPQRARTPRRYPSFVVLAVLGALGSLVGWPDLGPTVVGALQVGGLALYLYWYSEFGASKSRFLAVGETLPEFEASRADGTHVTSAQLRGSPAVILFYRGNWCPVCTAQIQELAREYDELAARGVRVVLISPQPDHHSLVLSKRIGLPLEYWTDRDNRAAQQLNIVDPAGLPLGMEALDYGSETPIPTAIVIDAQGRILYSDQAENYRIRPEPREYLKALDGTAPRV